MKISVGIPIYDRKLDFEVINCLLTEQAIALSLGDRLTVRFLSSCTNLAIGRNQIVKDFLDSGDDKLVFLDADVTFEAGKLVKLAHYPFDFVGGAYPLKQPVEDYPVAFWEQDQRSNEYGLLDVKMVPTGFLALSRRVFEIYQEKYPNRSYPSGDKENYCYFQIPYANGNLYTEDSFFCEEWRNIGGKIYLDPEITLTHWNGNIPFKGHVGNWMKQIGGVENKPHGEANGQI